MKTKSPTYTGVSFRAKLTPKGEPYIDGLTYVLYPGYKFQGNGTLSHPLRIIPVLADPVSNKGLTLRHPADTALVAAALNQFQQALTMAIPGKKVLTDIYGLLAAVHLAPRLEGERACVHCGCTDSHACPGGCAWSIKHKATPTGVCSRCVHQRS